MKNNFMAAVENTPEVHNGYNVGIKAIKGADRCKIKARNSSLIDGSVDIDTCVKAIYPNDPRWDYVISYNNKVCFLEIHPAFAKEIDKMGDKLQWLKKWLESKAPEIQSLPKSSPAYFWVPSGKVGFLPTSKDGKRAAQLGLTLTKELTLNF